MEPLVPIARALFAVAFITGGMVHFTQRSALVAEARRGGIPAAEVGVLGSGAMLILGGMSILLGYHVRIGAALVAFFLLVASFTVHRFWSMKDPVQVQIHVGHFMKNLALIGASLLIIHFGPGPFSLGQ